MWLAHWDVVCTSVFARQAVPHLALDIGHQCAHAHAEQVGLGPLVAKFILHHRQPVEDVLSAPDAARGLEADLVASAIVVVADGADHDESDLQVCVRLQEGGG